MKKSTFLGVSFIPKGETLEDIAQEELDVKHKIVMLLHEMKYKFVVADEVTINADIVKSQQIMMAIKEITEE